MRPLWHRWFGHGSAMADVNTERLYCSEDPEEWWDLTIVTCICGVRGYRQTNPDGRPLILRSPAGETILEAAEVPA